METSLVSQQRNVSKRIRAEIARIDWPKKKKKRIKEKKERKKRKALIYFVVKSIMRIFLSRFSSFKIFKR